MINHQQAEVFVDGISRYFEHLDHDNSVNTSLEIGAPFILDYEQENGLDYTGFIAVSGNDQGNIFFSATSCLLKTILLNYGVSELTDSKHKDIVGEVANTIAGNARRYLGNNFLISTPTVIEGSLQSEHYDTSHRSYVIPLRWKSKSAQLIVNL